MVMLSPSCLQIWREVSSSSRPAEKEGHGVSGWGCREGVWEWNECPERGCGAWWPYKSERVGLGRFGHVWLMGRLWLGNRGGGEGPGGPGSALVG
jgi:hypothetical protein